MAELCCAFPGCVALACERSTFCIFHLNIQRRQYGDVAVYCYACGRIIRIGALWLVRSEGAFHVRPGCMHAPLERYKIPARSVAPQFPVNEERV